MMLQLDEGISPKEGFLKIIVDAVMKKREVHRAICVANRRWGKLPPAEISRHMKQFVNVIAKGSSSLGSAIGTAADILSIFPALHAD